MMKQTISMISAAIVLLVIGTLLFGRQPQVVTYAAGSCANRGAALVATDESGSFAWPCSIPGDLDCDCDVDIVDIMGVAAHWREDCD